MTTRLNPYLAFRDTARQAMDFYHSVFGGEVTHNTFGDSDPEGDMHPSGDPAEQAKIMHSMLITEGGLTLMAADTPKSMELTAGGNSFSVSLSGEDETELRGYWDKLAEGAEVTMPLEKAPWGDSFGMLTDRYGVSWMVNIAGGQS